MVFIRTDSLGNSICPNSDVVLPQLSFTPIVDSIINTGNVTGDASFNAIAAGISLSPANYCIPKSLQDLLFNDEGFQLSPNPVQNLLTINLSSPSAAATIAVYDVQGRKIILPTIFSNNNVQLNTAPLPTGIYMLQIINSKTGEREAGKFAKEE